MTRSHLQGAAGMHGFDLADEELIPVVWAAIDPVVRAAIEAHGRLPRLRAAEFANAPVLVQRAVLLVGGSWLVFGDPTRHLLKQVSLDVHGGDTGNWHDWAANHVPFDELQRRRGVEIGPDGCPRGVRRPGDSRPDREGAA